MSLQERVISAAARHAKLIQDVTENEDAPAAVQQAGVYVDQLPAQIAAETKNVQKHYWKVSKERSEYEGYRDDYVKRFTYRLVGKKAEYEARTGREEREYQQALEAQANAKARLERLKMNLEEAKLRKQQLERAAANYAASRAELDAFYESIFNTPNSTFSEEQSARDNFRRLEVALKEAQRKLVIESELANLLTDADKYFTWAMNNAQNAKITDSQTIGMVHRVEDSVIRNAMNQAQAHANQAELLMDSARRVNPQIKVLPHLRITETDYLLDAMTNPNAMPLGFSAKINATMKELKAARASLAPQIQQVKDKLAIAQDEARDLQASFEPAKAELRRIQADIFQRLVGGETVHLQPQAAAGPSEAPPSYVP